MISDDLRVSIARSSSVGFYLVCFSLALHLQILLVMLRYYLKLESLQSCIVVHDVVLV